VNPTQWPSTIGYHVECRIWPFPRGARIDSSQPSDAGRYQPRCSQIARTATCAPAGPQKPIKNTEPFRRAGTSLERLRVDRQLDEALRTGADPLHLAALFGLDEKTAIRYSAAARQLMTTDIERTAPQPG